AGDFVVDGEVVGLVSGRPSFGALQQGSAETVEYWLFDLLWLLGHDLRHLPLEERKALLTRLAGGVAGVNVVPRLDGAPARLLEGACQDGWEGLIAKRLGSPYRAGRSGDWLKLKCAARQELVIGGFTPPQRARTGFGALLLGYWRDGLLVYAGKVGTGFSQAMLSQLLGELLRLERSRSPFSAPVTEKGARWVEPHLVAEVAFGNWTADGRLRHPSFLGLRRDKPADEVVREEFRPHGDARRDRKPRSR
ncbi:MAG TPA: non-homologous end-joining DNA ligase, partial [Acidimicrobiales bacterium]|nr:non-homologous end-joining DNA ligase [Acidimicrobiales bacterium]